MSNDQAQRAPGERDDEGLCHDLQDEPRPAGAERGANGDLFLAGQSASQNEVRDIGARDEKNEGDSAQHHEQRWLDGRNGVIAHVDDESTPTLVIVRVSKLEAPRDCGDLGLRLLYGDSRPQSSDAQQAVLAADSGLFVGHREWRPQKRETRLEHLRAHDADYRVLLSVELDVFADDGAVTAVVALP